MKLFLLIFVLLLIGCQNTSKISFSEIKVADTRKPAVAGTFYPADQAELEKMLADFDVQVQKEDIAAIIVPHAGYIYSGKTAAAAFSRLKNYKKVIVIGPSHTKDFRGATIPNTSYFETPLGSVKVSSVAQELMTKDLFAAGDKDDKEHCIEVELPFLQKYIGSFELVPVVIGPSTSYAYAQVIGATLSEYMDKETLIVVSSDFTHYGPNYRYVPFAADKDKIQELDDKAISYILTKDAKGFYDNILETRDTVCGYLPITILLHIINSTELRPQLVAYQTSGNVTGDFINSVSYASIIFMKPDPISKAEQQLLLKLARDTIKGAFENKEPQINQDSISSELIEKKGCFVTLTKDGQLRGCIGHIVPQESLYECVRENAINAAFHDTRFNELAKDELDDVHIEISVLSVPQELSFSDAEGLKSKLIPLVDGVILSQGYHQSTYLPQVWETLPDGEQFLSSLCIKGGMPQDCWKDKKTKVSTYQAFVFEE